MKSRNPRSQRDSELQLLDKIEGRLRIAVARKIYQEGERKWEHTLNLKRAAARRERKKLMEAEDEI